jgi:hypothetical protein
MLKQATGGDIDFITGDYLAGKLYHKGNHGINILIVKEMNLAENALAYKAGQHPGYVESAWAGLQESLDVIAERGIKVVINGGCLNPAGLAAKVSSLVRINLNNKFRPTNVQDIREKL